MKKKMLSILLVAAMTSAVFVGCGNTKKEEAKKEETVKKKI